MPVTVDDLTDESRFTHFLTIPYKELLPFVLDYLRKTTSLTVIFWSICTVFFGMSVFIRVDISGLFEFRKIILHTILGSVLFPLLIIPLHEGIHIIPYFLAGARNIKICMDLRQYMFYVTAHRFVVTPFQFKLIALAPFIIINLAALFLVFYLPGLWKWSFSLFLFFHSTMCAGDFALLNFYHINRSRRIYTWDDANLKETYFYAEI
jgi:hypothetical protein